MRKKSILFVFFICINLHFMDMKSQILTVDTVGFDMVKYNNLFSALNPKLITTGFLADKSLQMVNLSKYEGKSSNELVSLDLWKQLYLHAEEFQCIKQIRPLDSLYNGFIKKIVQFRSLSSAVAIRRIEESINNEEMIPISIINIDYDKIKESAISQKKIILINDQLKEASPNEISTNIYDIKQMYAVSAMKDKIYNGETVNFVFDESLYVTNRKNMNHNIEVDFDDGNGYAAVNLGETVVVNYMSVGPKNLKIKDAQTYTSNNVVTASENISTFQIEVVALSTPIPTFEIPLNIAIPPGYYHGGNNIQGTAYIYTSDGSTQIKNPIIVCEGFDPLNERGWNELYTLLNRENFIQYLKSNGYDFIILNFNEGGTYIERNAYLLKGLIEEVNSRKVSQNKLIVVGASMGGLISRFALAYMEKNGYNHDTRLYVSFDSPHRGANIPLGAQYWLKFFAKMNNTAKDKYDRLICSVAAQQMLVYHSISSPEPANNPLRLDFERNLYSMGFPNKLRKIAIANGAGNAFLQRKNDNSIFYPQEQIINWRYRNWWTVDIDGNSYALSDGPKSTIFYGNIDLTWLGHIGSWDFYDHKMTATMEGSLPYDNAPGGTTNSTEEIANTDAGYGDITTNVSNHCFIPTVSSLALNTGLNYNISGDPNILLKTSFDALYYPIDKNEEHVFISRACVDWMKNELVPHNIELNGTNNPAWNKGDVRAANTIVLGNGFSVKSGTQFRAYISPLSNYTYASSPMRTKEVVAESGASGYSEIDLDNGKNVIVYPNPNNGIFSVKAGVGSNLNNLILSDIQGRIVYKNGNDIFDECVIDITGQPNGVYILKFYLEDQIEVCKIIKQ